MALGRQELESMDIEQLVVYANMNYGLEVNKAFAKHDLINMIDAAQRKFKGNENIRVVNADDVGKVGPGMVKIRVQPGKYDVVPRPIVVGLNFKLATIPVNRDVIIPAKYLVCLEDAVQDTFHQHKNDHGELETVIQQEHAYAYSILERGPALPSKAKEAV